MEKIAPKQPAVMCDLMQTKKCLVVSNALFVIEMTNDFQLVGFKTAVDVQQLSIDGSSPVTKNASKLYFKFKVLF